MTFRLSTAVKRGRPLPAANDNATAYAERAEVIRGLRSRKMTFRQIADILNLNASNVYRTLKPESPRRAPLAANDNKVVRLIANNGGCSTTSGLTKVSLARVPTLERPEIALPANLQVAA